MVNVDAEISKTSTVVKHKVFIVIAVTIAVSRSYQCIC